MSHDSLLPRIIFYVICTYTHTRIPYSFAGHSRSTAPTRSIFWCLLRHTLRSYRSSSAVQCGAVLTENVLSSVANTHRVILLGDVELEMRGRSSAGQRVLASLLIRLALAGDLDSACPLNRFVLMFNFDTFACRMYLIFIHKLNREHERNSINSAALDSAN